MNYWPNMKSNMSDGDYCPSTKNGRMLRNDHDDDGDDAERRDDKKGILN